MRGGETLAANYGGPPKFVADERRREGVSPCPSARQTQSGQVLKGVNDGHHQV